MRIAITQRVVENSTYPERRDALSRDWSIYLIGIMPGCIILPAPNIPSYISEWLQALEIDAVLLSNGNDWLEAPDRDQTEIILLEYALKKEIPVLGVCRGLQVINSLLGGKLEGALSDVTSTNHVGKNHSVRLLNPAFSKIAGTGSVMANSYHNQGVLEDGVANDMKVFALADDGVVEGIYHSKMPVMAIQWHPERSGSASQFDARIMKKFFVEGQFWE